MSRPLSAHQHLGQPSGAAGLLPFIIAVYTHKGGTGKTTYAGLMGAMLAKMGYSTILVDADPQMSLTTHFAENNLEAAVEPEDDEEGEDEQVEREAEEEEQGGGADGNLLGPRLVLPNIPGDRLRKPDALTPDVFQGIKEWCNEKENLYDALQNTIASEAYVAQPTVVNGDDYNGRLMLLPGSAKLHRYSYDLEQTANTTFATKPFGAFRRAMTLMAQRYSASFVLVDLGPHTDTMHKNFITSCDAVQPVVGACHYSCFSTFNFLHVVAPLWIEWHRGFAAKHSKPAGYAYPSSFPRILPFLGLNFQMKGSHVQWSASNFFESLRTIIDGEGGDGVDPMPAEVKQLYLPHRSKKARSEPGMVVPFLKHLEHLPVAQECGRAFFDLKEQHLKDYYHHSTMNELNLAQLNKEREYVHERFTRLASVLIQLQKHRVQEHERQQQKRQEQERGQQPRQQAGKERRRQEAAPAAAQQAEADVPGTSASAALAASRASGKKRSLPPAAPTAVGAARRKPGKTQRVE